MICQIGRSKHNEKNPLVKLKLPPSWERFASQLQQQTFKDNLKSLAPLDAKAAEQIASIVIALKEVSPHGTIQLSKDTGGPSFRLTPSNVFALFFIL